MIQIDIADNQETLTLDHDLLAALARFTLQNESVAEAEISLVFVDNPRIHELNREYLQHDYPTDVITFPLSDGHGMLVGEIIVSTEYALSECGDYGWSPVEEAGLYVVHGLLHLCGYDDKTTEDSQRMHQRQDEIYRRFREEMTSLDDGETLQGRWTT